ncbi:ATP-binding protein [Aurantimonas sp. MSK8Z-1]|uniref:PAS domain-containing sensor histidine kinase n=1 Tax=Mangrovibrevibacter kandeliae TaxID=2968473 RepID=UPI0021193DEB|nr:ATP-binding protein [Aurantimonas sp. MSK8Z-1]MCW4113884.1 ATP-binding protein [Aurantimonas sp. MSK8Z-1]
MSRFEDLLKARAEVVGNARLIAQPAYQRLLEAEPAIRRTIPVLIALFLIFLACARGAALLDYRQRLETAATATLKVASALLKAESAAVDRGTMPVADAVNALLTSGVPPELATNGRFALVADESGRVIASLPGYEIFIGKNINDVLSGAQPLLVFGERAGVLETTLDGDPALVAGATLAAPLGTIVFIQPQAQLLAPWRQSVSLNVSLFAGTSLLMLVILFAYFRQSARAREADAIYLEAHQRVDTALSRGHCGLWDWDLARGRMYWSRSMYEMLGMTPREGVLSFGDVAPLLHPDDGSLYDVARAVAAGKIKFLDRSFRMMRADGSFVWLRARAEVMRSAENELHLIGIAVDVSEQQALARSTDEANDRLQHAVENISETFVLLDSRNQLVLCNSKYQEVFGLAPENVRPGTPYDELMATARKPIEMRTLTNPSFVEGQRVSEALLPDGRWLQISERRTIDGGLVSIGTDITQLKVHQERLSDSERRLTATISDLSISRRDAEAKAFQLSQMNDSYILEKERAESANRAKTTFLANMSHELRTPLNAIIGFSEIMREASFGPLGCDKYTEYADDIHQSGHYLLKLINDILDMSKIEAGRLILSPEDLDLGEILGEALKIVEIAAEQKDLTLRCDCAPTLRAVADRRATKQILLNLLANAVKFTDAGGSVVIRAKTVGSAAVFTVADTGIGIPKASLKTLGRPFEQVENELTRTNKGTGLGLAIARSLVELHGGAIRIASEVDKGTIVSLRMPLARPKSEPNRIHEAA